MTLPRTTPPTERFALAGRDGEIIAQFNSSWAVRVYRDELLQIQVDGTLRQRGRRLAWLQDAASGQHAEAGMESGRARTRSTSMRTGRRCPTTRSSTTRSRCSGRDFSATSLTARRSFTISSKEPKACSWRSSDCESWEQQRWLDVPTAGAMTTLSSRASTGRLESYALRAGRVVEASDRAVPLADRVRRRARRVRPVRGRRRGEQLADRLGIDTCLPTSSLAATASPSPRRWTLRSAAVGSAGRQRRN